MPTSLTILRDKLLYLLVTLALWVLVFLLQKPVFLLLHAGGLAQALSVMAHGLPLDLSMAGYLSVVPALLLLVSGMPLRVLHGGRAERVFGALWRGWTGVAAAVTALAFVANCGLYGYWRFPLDATPVFFITSSPTDALASVAWWQGLGALAATAAVAAMTYALFRLAARRFEPSAYKSVLPGGVLALLVATAALLLPIRGGVTVSSMNTGKVYFSDRPVLNHAAVNPLFSFMESMSHQQDFTSQYRYVTADAARRLAAPMLQDPFHRIPPKRLKVLRADRPDIYLIILESFSDTLMRVPGVTPQLNRLCREGVYFSRFYANSFRTDRGLVSILHGYPSPATVSLMKFPKITAALPSLPEELGRMGWGLDYYYGGDADFTNMRSFLVNQGFARITEDVDFPLADRLSKWGVPDHLLFRRVEADLAADRSARPMLRVIQTSSSHEPFDVPSHRLSDPALNAFAYADSCLGGFVDYLKRSGRWQRSLVVVVPDHLGAWPADADNYAPWRFHIPMVWTGGAVAAPRVVDTYGSQQDIAATLLGQLGQHRSVLRFSKDMLDASERHFAFFMMNDGFGLIDHDNTLVYDHKRQRAVVDGGPHRGRNLSRGKAYVQTLFDDIASTK